MPLEQKEFVPGLAGVPAAESSVSYIDGLVGILEYRGHRIEVLAERSDYEEVVWLLLHDALPTQAELDGFRARLAEYRKLPAELVDVLRSLPIDGHPMDALQVALAAAGMFRPRFDVIHDEAARKEASLHAIAVTGPLIATFERFRRGEEYLESDPSLTTAENFLYQMNGVKPDAQSAKILDVALVLHADHTMNASTFAMRVVAGTETDPYTAFSAAVGALKGPLHGGANERVLRQLETIGSADNVAAWLDKTLAAKGKIMGFGHRVYKTKDPRATMLEGLTHELFAKQGSTPVIDTALALEKAVVERLGEKGIHPNVDFFSGIVYSKLGIPTDAFTPIFALARVAGYAAHWREQMANNRLYRPGQVFIGSHGAEYIPIGERG
ncbi:MAG: citrate synthase [Chlamydiales bacterium]